MKTLKNIIFENTDKKKLSFNEAIEMFDIDYNFDNLNESQKCKRARLFNKEQIPEIITIAIKYMFRNNLPCKYNIKSMRIVPENYFFRHEEAKGTIINIEFDGLKVNLNYTNDNVIGRGDIAKYQQNPDIIILDENKVIYCDIRDNN